MLLCWLLIWLHWLQLPDKNACKILQSYFVVTHSAMFVFSVLCCHEVVVVFAPNGISSRV